VRQKTILVGEDDSEVRAYLGMTLRCSGYNVEFAVDGEEVISHLRSGGPVSLVLLDIMMPSKDGWETLRDIRNMRMDVPVIMLSGMFSPPNVVQAIKSGATDFLAKPVGHEDLNRAIERASGGPVQDEAPPDLGSAMFFGADPAMELLKASLPKVAASDVPVLIQGETGTGKEVLARLLHGLSARKNRPFVKLNCAALPSELVESELFGYERGAFTGALQKKVGLFELANGGTILLDEIGDMDVRLQAKLLQVLQDQKFRRLGGTDVVRVNVRVIAATHRDLTHAIREGAFREDLYYRLNVFTLALPSLRERKDDILGLTEFLIARHNSPEAMPPALPLDLQAALVACSWPGNIRQLENIVRKLLVLRDPGLIVHELRSMEKGVIVAAAETTVRSGRKPPGAEFGSVFDKATRAKEEAEAEAILDALQSARWNRKRAAALLRIDYKALLYKMKKMSIEDRARRISLSA